MSAWIEALIDALRAGSGPRRPVCEAVLREIEARLTDGRRRLGGEDDDDAARVRVPRPQGPSPLRDAAHVEPPTPRAHLDVVGTRGGAATVEEWR